jgi:hypothetical protein
MTIEFNKILYNKLNSKQKENYNFHVIAAKLAEYGFNSMRLSDDWQGADFISVHVGGEEMLKIQLKGRFTIDKKYLGKDIWVTFIENAQVKIYKHDDAIPLLRANVLNGVSWATHGGYSWNRTPKVFESIITIL